MADGAYMMAWDNSTSSWVKVAATANGALETSDGSFILDPVGADILGSTFVSTKKNQIEVSFESTPNTDLITNTTSGGGSVTQSNGHSLYSTGTSATSSAKGVSVLTTKYRAANEIYSYFTAAFTVPTSANSSQRIGLFNTNNGFFIGYSGLTFGITKRTATVDTFTARTSFNGDLLDGSSTSSFTRNGVPEAIDLTKSNLFRIRFAWLGSASIKFEVFNPDGQWIVFHTIKQPNLSLNPSIESPDLPMTIEATKTSADATSIIIYTACWAAGTTSDLEALNSTLTDYTLASVNRSVITGRTTAGGTSYVNVKVTPSGSLTTAIGDITGVVGQNTMANSLPVAIASNQSAIPITDNSGSLTVDNAGTFAVQAAQSGTWSTRTQDGSGNNLTSATRGSERALSVQVVDGSGSQITSFGGGTQYAEDVASAGGESLTLAGAIRQDSPSSSTSLDGDYANLKTDSVGRLWVNNSGVTQPVSGTFWQATQPVSIAAAVAVTDNSGSLTVDNAGTFAVQAAQSGTWNITNVSGTISLPTGASTLAEQQTQTTSLQLLDDVVVADNAAFTDGTTKLDMAGYIYDEVAGTALTENDAAAARINVNRAQVLVVEDGTTRGRYATVSAANALKVDGSAVTQPVSGTFWQATQPVSIAAAVAVTDNAGSLTVDAPVGTPVFVRLSDGTAAISTLPVSLASVPSHAVTNAGTFVVQENGAALTALQLLDDVVATDGSAALTKLYQVGGTDGTNAQILSTNASGHVNIADGGNSITVDGTVAATQSGTWSTRTQDGSGNNLTSAARGSERALSVQIVDGSGAQITSFGGGTQYTEDVASTGGESLTLAGAVREDSPSSSTSLDGDYSTLKTDSTGKLWVNVGNSLLTTQGASAVASGPAANPFLMAGLVQDGTLDTQAVGNLQYLMVDTDGALQISDGGNSITVDGSVNVTVDNGTISVAGIVGSLEIDNQIISSTDKPIIIAGQAYDFPGPTSVSHDGDLQYIWLTKKGAVNISDADGSITVDAPVSTPVFVRLSDGASPIATLPVSLASVPSHAVTNAGTFAVQVDGSALTSLQLLDDVVVADNAGFTDGTTKLDMVGYIYDEVAGTALTENDAAAARINANRAQVLVVEDGTTRGRYATVSAANALKVDGSAVTQPVSGTFWQATQPVSIAAAVAVTDNAGSLTVDAPVGTPVFVRLSDGTAAISTLPVSLASVPSHAVTNAGTFVVQENGAALTSLQLLDDVVVADNAAFTDGTTKLSMAGYIYDEVAGTALTENDAAAARINANRAQVFTMEDGVTRGRYATVSAANALKVDGSAVTQPVSIAAAVAVTDNASSLTVDAPVGTPVFVRLSDGAAAISTLPVSLASVPSHAVTNAGTFAVQVDGAALTSLQLLDDTIIADDAAFTVGTTKVNMAGGYVVAHGANPDAADAGDAGAVLMNRHRIPFTMGGHPNTTSAEYYSSGNITDDNILPAISAGTKYVITGITVAASAANTTNATVRIGFGATTVPAQGATNADAVAKVVMSLPGIPPGGGAVKGNGGGIVGVGGDGEELRVTITNMASGALTIVVDYYTIES